MFILDSLSLKAAAASTTKQQQKSTIFKEFIEQQSIGEQQEKAINNLTTATQTYEMTTNKYKQHQQQNKVVEKVMIEKNLPPHEMKEVIKNNSNENLNNDEQQQQTRAVKANNTTIGDNTMPQEQYSTNNKQEWGKVLVVPAKLFDCNNSKCSNTNTTTTPTIVDISSTLNAMNVDNCDDNNIRAEKQEEQEEEEIMLTKMQNNVNFNTFVLQPPSAVTTAFLNTNSSCCSPCIGMSAGDSDSIGILQQQPEHGCTANNDSHDYDYACAGNADDGGISNGSSGSFCHNSNNTNNNNIILNTNSFVTVQCALLACENEREQEAHKQNGYENSGNVNTVTTANAATIAELSSALKENELFSHLITEGSVGNFAGNEAFVRCTLNEVDLQNPQDTVLENFEKFLNSVKLENFNLNRTIAECDDLIDLSENSKCSAINQVETLVSEPLVIESGSFTLSQELEQENVIQDKCAIMEQADSNLAPIFNDKFEKTNAIPQYQTTGTDNKMHVNNIENNCNFENLVYCDLNETLEEQHLLESKEIVEFTAELTLPLLPPPPPPPPPKITTNEIKRADNVDDNSTNTTTCINENMLMMMTMVDTMKVNETKTPVTCVNVNSNYNGSDNNCCENTTSNNNSKKQLPMNWQTCARIEAETCQNKPTDSGCSQEVTEQPATITTWSSSIENISPHCKNINQNQHTNTAGVSSLSSSSCCRCCCCSTTTTAAELWCNCQYTSAYTLRDFAKCRKPSADEDIIYTLNFKQNIEKTANENEKLQNLQLTQSQLNKSAVTDIKSIENCEINEKQVHFNENNNLYNKFLNEDTTEADKGFFVDVLPEVDIFQRSQTREKIAKDFQEKSEKLLETNEIVKLKDTQFLELENLTTPKFSHHTPTKENAEVQPYSHLQFENSENSQNFDELKFDDCNEKIYTKTQHTQPLLYLTFVWPTKNEGQVVTTSQQGNEDDQRETNEIAEQEYKTFNRQHNYSSNNNNNNTNNAAEKNENVNHNDDECFQRRVLEKTYGTCNIKDVEGSQEQADEVTLDDKLKDNLFAQRTLIDEQKCEFKNQCLHQNERDEKINEIIHLKKEENPNFDENNEKFPITNENYKKTQCVNATQQQLQIKEKFIIESEKIHGNNEKTIENNECFNKIEPQQLIKRQEFYTKEENVKKIHENNEKFHDHLKGAINNRELISNKNKSIENTLELSKEFEECNREKEEKESEIHENALTNEICELSENLKNQKIINVYTDNVNENISTTKSLDTNINHHNRLNLNTTNSVYNQDNDDDHLNLEEFEASQRLQRLLQQHQQFRARYDTIPTTPFDCHKQTTNGSCTENTTTRKSLNFEIARHSKELLKGKLNSNNLQEGVANKITTNTTTTTTTTTTTKANKLQADYETTLERSSLLHANEQKQKLIEINEYQDKQNGEEIENDKEVDKNKKGVKVSNNINTQQQQQEEQEQEKEAKEHNPNSPLAYVSEKVVRLSQQQQQQQKLFTNPLTVLTTDKQHFITANHPQELPIPIENSKISKTIPKCSPTKQCNLNLQHIVNTKQIVKEENLSTIPKESVPSAATLPLASPPQPLLNEYKSAFVSTKPEIYKCIKPLTQTTTDCDTTNTTAAQATLSEFDTQRFSDFLHLNHLAIAPANNNPQLLHVLPNQQQQHQPFPLYATNANTIFHCYDELLNENITNNNNFNNNTLSNNSATVLAHDNDIACEDDLISISSTNSSPCDCINCQAQLQDEEVFNSDCEISSNNFVTSNQKSLNMREVNGQLRGLLKKPNRPPPTRKNRVVFDETRNEFFEADYIILIREDCAYDEEDEEPCTCGEHELVRLCCEEGCQCNYSTAPATTDDNRTPQSPKFAPPIEFVDDAALSPPDGYKDNGLKNTLGGALSGHIFGAQHLQQLQVIQRLQQQRAAMLAARNNTQIPPPPPPATASAASVNQQSSTTAAPSSSSPLTSSAVSTAVASNNSINQSAGTQLQQHSPDDDTQGVCTECAECAECAAKQLQQDAECNSPQCQEDLTAPLVGVPAVALLPIHTSSPERRMTQKEIIAGEERPRYVLQAQYKSSPVTERRIVREASEDVAAANTVTGTTATGATAVAAGADSDLLPPALPAKPGAASSISNNNNNNDLSDSEKPPPIPPKESSPTTQISGILKGGKLWKQDSISQSDDQNNTTSEDEAGSTSNGTLKRSVRFVTEEISTDDVDGQSAAVDEDNQINELIPIKKHSTLFKNAFRPNSAVQQLFPSTAASHQTLTSEALRAFDESKRAGCLVSTLPGSAGDSDTLRRSMERNILRRSLIKKKAVKSDITLEDRIKQLTCGIDEDNDESAQENADDDNSKMDDNSELSHRDSPAGEENPQKFTGNGNNSDKSFSPNSSVSSSSSGSSAYKKISEIFNREKKTQEKIMEMEENPIVIIPQECRCPAAPDLGMGVQVPVVHTQIHRTPPRQTEPKRQFLSTLAPLTACVAGNKDDLSSYYTLAAAHHHNQAAQNAHAAEYNLAAMMAGEQNSIGLSQGTGDEVRKVAPDVIAGTPGQEQQDELAAFAQQEANRTEKIKKRYGNEPINPKESKEINSDDDEGNDYGFNKRPSVRGIKPKFSSTNEILQQMQDQLSQQMPSVAHSQPLPQAMKSYTLPKPTSSKQKPQQQQPSPQNVPHSTVATSQQQLPQQQQICNTIAPQNAQMQMPANAAIAQQQTEQRTWSFYRETAGGGGGGEQQQQQQRLPVESAAAMQQTYYQTLPAGAMFRHTMIHQQHGQEEAMMYAQNCQAMATTIEQPPAHYGHYARSPTRRPESPPPLRNYHQTMVLIPYNAETYSQFAASNMDPKVAHIQRQNILEYQQVGEMTQVTQQTIRVPIGYALPGMQLHVVAGQGHAAQYGTSAAAQTHHHQHQRIMTQRYQFAQEANMAGFSERGVPEGAAAVSHSDCASSGMVSPTTGQQIAMQQQQQQQHLQQNAQMAQQQHQQQQVSCQQQQQQQQQPQAQSNMQSAAQGSVYYAMNV